MTRSASAVLFARDARRVARFYTAVFGAIPVSEDESRVALDLRGFRLVIHAIPAHLAKDVEIGDPPVRREMTAIRLDYPVDDLVMARHAAASLGGGIDDAPPPWAGPDSRFFLGFDPEGNVFGVKTQGS